LGQQYNDGLFKFNKQYKTLCFTLTYKTTNIHICTQNNQPMHI